MMSAKLATLGFLKIMVFWNKADDVIIFVHDVTNKIFWRGSNYIVDVVLRPKFGESSISMKGAIITSILYGFDQKIKFFEECFWFKVNNMVLEQGLTLNFYTSVTEGLKLKARKIWGANSNVCRSYRGKTSRGPFCHPSTMNRFNIFMVFADLYFSV